MNVNLPVAKLSSKGIIRTHKHTDLLGCPENSLNGQHFSGFVGVETWHEWECWLKERDEIIVPDVISVTPTGVWKSTNQLSRINRQSIHLEALKLEQIKGDLFSAEFARATDGWVLTDHEKALIDFLGSLPPSVHFRFINSCTCQEIDPFKADAAVAVCDLPSQGKALSILNRGLSRRAPELFTLLPNLQTINTRAGDLMGKPYTRPSRSPAIKLSKSNFSMGNNSAIVGADPEIITEGMLPNGEPEIYRVRGFNIHDDILNEIRASRARCTITLHSDDPKTGFMPVLVKPMYTWHRLNRHPSEYLGREIDYIDSRLSIPAKLGIENAIANGSFISQYDFEWDQTPGELWRFWQTFAHLTQHGLIRKETVDDEEDYGFWQSNFWLRRIINEMAKPR